MAKVCVAYGYLIKTSGGAELRTAIAAVMRGKRYLRSLIAKRQTERFISDPHMPPDTALTHRQREVLQLFAEGKFMKEAAAELHISMRTIAFHKYRIMEQHGLRTNSDLVRFAIKQQVVAPSS